MQVTYLELDNAGPRFSSTIYHSEINVFMYINMFVYIYMFTPYFVSMSPMH